MSLFWFLGPGGSSSGEQNKGTPGARLMLWTTFFSVAALVTWSYFSKIDKITRAPGVVIASSRTQVIQSQEGGTLEDLLVREGDVVEPRQVLAKLERTRLEAAYLEARGRAAALAATHARLNAEVFGKPMSFGPETEDYPEFRRNQSDLKNKRWAALQEEIGALERTRKLIEQELKMNIPLLASGDVSRTEILRLQRQMADLEAQATNRRNRFFQEAQAELNKTLEDLTAAQQQLAQRKNQLEQTELRAPVHGVVKNVRITTQGGVIRPGEEVMQIVPLEDDLIIEARVSPSDIAFLSLGLKAVIKIDSYDFTIYGGLPGVLSFISADTMSEGLKQNEAPYYRVQVKTTSRQFPNRPNTNLEIQPGMTATVEIKTGERTVFQYLSKPVLKTLSESLGER